MAKSIEELRAELRAMEEAERNAGRAEYDAVKKAATFEWRVTPQPFGFRVECRYDAESRARVEAWREAFPKASIVNFRAPEQWHGMSYHLGYSRDGSRAFIVGGGGAVILKRDNTFGPEEITIAQAEAFERGEVPEELKKPW